MKKILALMVLGAFSMVTFATVTDEKGADAKKGEGKKKGKGKKATTPQS